MTSEFMPIRYSEPFHSKAPDQQQSKAFNFDILVFFGGGGGITS